MWLELRTVDEQTVHAVKGENFGSLSKSSDLIMPDNFDFKKIKMFALNYIDWILIL